MDLASHTCWGRCGSRVHLGSGPARPIYSPCWNSYLLQGVRIPTGGAFERRGNHRSHARSAAQLHPRRSGPPGRTQLSIRWGNFVRSLRTKQLSPRRQTRAVAVRVRRVCSHVLARSCAIFGYGSPLDKASLRYRTTLSKRQLADSSPSGSGSPSDEGSPRQHSSE